MPLSLEKVRNLLSFNSVVLYIFLILIDPVLMHLHIFSFLKIRHLDYD